MTEAEQELSLDERITRMPDRYLACRDYGSHGWNYPPKYVINNDGATITRKMDCLRCGMKKEMDFDRRTAERVGYPRYVPPGTNYYLKGYGRVDAVTFRAVLIDKAMRRARRAS